MYCHMNKSLWFQRNLDECQPSRQNSFFSGPFQICFTGNRTAGEVCQIMGFSPKSLSDNIENGASRVQT